MIVQSMTLSEIKKSVFDDYTGEIKNKIEAVKITHRGKWERNGRKDFVETIHFPVKSRNNWRITITCNKNSVNAIPYLISYDKIGITAMHIPLDFETTPLMYFNTHFFKRYKERAAVKIEKPEDLVKNFFRKNTFMIPCYSPLPDDTTQLFTPLAGGIGLGKYYDEPDICEFKTFVDYSLLGKDQIEEINDIWNNTLTQLTDEINRRLNKK